MFTIGIDPVILRFGHFGLHWYGVIVFSAVAVGTWLIAREAARKGFRPEDVYDSALWVLLGAVAGARLFHVIDHWSHNFAADPIRILYIWEGGLAIWGGVFGGLLALLILAWRRGWHLPFLLDMAAPGLVLGQALGRVACVITGDAMGQPTAGPFGIAYSHPAAMVPELGVYYTPMPLYESAANLAVFALLWRLRKKSLPHGALALIYLGLYSSVRFSLAFVSSYRVVALGMTQSQLVALATLAVVLPLLLWLWRPRKLAIGNYELL
jgi:phosphatidylglycerol---prolipoprotein diacylglyceryl transferase